MWTCVSLRYNKYRDETKLCDYSKDDIPETVGSTSINKLIIINTKPNETKKLKRTSMKSHGPIKRQFWIQPRPDCCELGNFASLDLTGLPRSRLSQLIEVSHCNSYPRVLGREEQNEMTRTTGGGPPGFPRHRTERVFAFKDARPIVIRTERYFRTGWTGIGNERTELPTSEK